MASLAWRERLVGRTLARSSLLRPFDLIMEQLERYPQEDRGRLRAASADEVFAFLDRIAPAEYKPGRRKAEAIQRYVGTFFERLLAEEHRDDATRLLARQRLLRSAYHQYVREAIPVRTLEATGDLPEAVIDPQPEDGEGSV
jgi:hypothetical protein